MEEKVVKLFLKKWGFSIKFFTKHYLRGCKTTKYKLIICNKYDGLLKNKNLATKKFRFILNVTFINSNIKR